MSPERIAHLFDELSGPMHGVPFMDITDHQEVIPAPAADHSLRESPLTPEQIESVMANINMVNPRSNLQYLAGVTSTLINRKHNHAHGTLAAQWIQQIMQGYCNQYGRTDCTTRLFTHSRTAQPSVIVRLPGRSASQQVVIVGAHLDSTAPTDRAPGANDDGSGTVTIMEAARSFLESRLVHDLPIEIQFYAAEEAGLWGSADIAARYATDRVQVRSMIQFDMNGCCSAASGLPRGTQYSVCTDAAFTNAVATQRLRDAITRYGDRTQRNFQYGYAASDHASFARNGYVAVHVKESVSYSPIHTQNDVFNNIDFEYLDSFTKVAVGWMISESGARFEDDQYPISANV
jgi:leucyl aminopeptidase